MDGFRADKINNRSNIVILRSSREKAPRSGGIGFMISMSASKSFIERKAISSQQHDLTPNLEKFLSYNLCTNKCHR